MGRGIILGIGPGERWLPSTHLCGDETGEIGVSRRNPARGVYGLGKTAEEQAARPRRMRPFGFGWQPFIAGS